MRNVRTSVRKEGARDVRNVRTSVRKEGESLFLGHVRNSQKNARQEAKSAKDLTCQTS